MKKTQLNFIKEHILKYGYISRNFCLRNWITRLGARIIDLEKQGFKFSAGYEDMASGKDYVYRLVNDEISAYKFGQKQPPASVSGQNTNNMPDKLNRLNNRLRAILDNIKPSWSNADEIKKLANALKSNNEWTKISVLRGYEN